MLNKRGMATIQIFILIFSIVSFSFILDINFVKADHGGQSDEEIVLEKGNLNGKPSPSLVIPAGLSAAKKIGTQTAEVFELSSSINYDGYSITKIAKDGEKYIFNAGGESKEIPRSVLQSNNIINSKGELIRSAIKGSAVDASSTIAGWLKLEGGSAADAIVSGAQYAGIVGGAAYAITSFLGLDSDQSKSVSLALSAGAFTTKSIHTLATKGFLKNSFVGANAGLWSFGVGAAVSAGIFIATYKSVSTETITFTCDVWQAPVGGSNCELCNKQGELSCSEYQCRSLGQACQLLNPGTEDENCAWVNKNDVNPPVIRTSIDALLSGYVYTPDNTISPPDKGVKVENTALASKCAPAFTPLTFGIFTNEPAMCKISSTRKDTFEEMEFFFGGSNALKYNHTQVMVLPSKEALEAEGIVMEEGGNFEVYTRCQDANGNANTANFVFKYCVEEGPDTTPPLIVTTSLLNNMPIAYDLTSVDIDVYVNEPSECKWDHLDKEYNDMIETMSCSSNVFEINSQMLYKCSTTLTGLLNEVENNFYFRCKDKPTAPEADRNVNTESYLFTLIGTRPLVIDSVSPNGETIRDATDIIEVVLEVETSAGYNEGESSCYYSDTGDVDSFIKFYNTDSYTHSQELWLAEGDYTYHIKCVDLGGNTDEEIITFTVESDSGSPIVVRAYHATGNLKIITNEDANCVYDTTSCSYNFEDGISMSTVDGFEHRTDWDTTINYYIKCEDSFGNKPLPNVCNIIARPAEV